MKKLKNLYLSLQEYLKKNEKNLSNNICFFFGIIFNANAEATRIFSGKENAKITIIVYRVFNL